MIKNYTSLVLVFLIFGGTGIAQDIQIFNVEDFDLRGNVKSCLVITDYGRELFEFDEKSRLVRSVTRYNESDQDITLYKYQGEELVEKRMESYKDEVLDASTSMANFYTIETDSLKKVKEKIISYDKQFLEQQEYEYDDKGQLVKLTTSHGGGVDETTVEYQQYKTEMTQSFSTNGILQKSIRTSEKRSGGQTFKIILTKEFLDGEPNRALEETFNAIGKRLKSERFTYDTTQKQFVSNEKLTFGYDADGMLTKETTETQNAKSVKTYIFQFDNNPTKNWIKKIVTPGNAYTTRKIAYYPEVTDAETPN
ncbi:MAG: hypothetical protein AAF765_09505 [Bacteroidota bacterium]